MPHKEPLLHDGFCQARWSQHHMPEGLLRWLVDMRVTHHLHKEPLATAPVEGYGISFLQPFEPLSSRPHFQDFLLMKNLQCQGALDRACEIRHLNEGMGSGVSLLGPNWPNRSRWLCTWPTNPYLGNMLVLNNWKEPLWLITFHSRVPMLGSQLWILRYPIGTLPILMWSHTCQLWWAILLGAMLNVLARNSHQHGTKKTSFHFENHVVDISVSHFGGVRGFHFGNHELFIVGLPFRLPCSSTWILSPKGFYDLKLQQGAFTPQEGVPL